MWSVTQSRDNSNGKIRNPGGEESISSFTLRLTHVMCGVLLQCAGSCQEEDLLALHATPSPRLPLPMKARSSAGRDGPRQCAHVLSLRRSFSLVTQCSSCQNLLFGNYTRHLYFFGKLGERWLISVSNNLKRTVILCHHGSFILVLGEMMERDITFSFSGQL